jgi:hypothetical protein
MNALKKRWPWILVLLLALGLGAILLPVHKNHVSGNNNMNEVNAILMEAKIPAFNDWVVNAKCGPTDAFIGYSLVPKQEQDITDEQFSSLKSVLSARGLAAGDIQAGGYSVEGDDWKISVYTDQNGQRHMASAEISSNDKPKGYPDGSLVCG